MNLTFLGPPNAGKGTQAKMLFTEFGIPQISTGDMLRQARRDGTELGKKVGPLMDLGQLVPDELVIRIADERLRQPDAAKGFVLDGFPRTIPQAETLEAMLARTNKKIDAVISLEVPHEKLIERGSGRRICPNDGTVYHVVQNPPKRPGYCDRDGAGLIQRPDDTPEVIEKRLQAYDRDTKPLKEYYARRGLLSLVDGIGRPEGIFEEIKKAARKK